MRETERIGNLLALAFNGNAYYGPSVFRALESVNAKAAARKPNGAAHSIWELVSHLTAEIRYANAMLAGTAGPWVAGQTTWPEAIDATSAAAWRLALTNLAEENRSLIRAVEQLEDTVLDKMISPVNTTHYVALHGTIQHHVYHAGQISLLKKQMGL